MRDAGRGPFTGWRPCSADPFPTDGPMPIDALSALRDKRVLVVEDEDLVARELRHDLE